MLKPNNILSYFIKDITDPKECSLYEQKNINNTIRIFYKDKIIYQIVHNTFKPYIIWNYKNNFSIEYFSERITNYKINSCKSTKYKELFYKKDNKIANRNAKYLANCIYYNYEHIKYLIKTYIGYIIANKTILAIIIEYCNGYKYLYKCYNRNYKYNYSHICIMNKYELYYNSIFFYLYFVIRNYKK